MLTRHAEARCQQRGIRPETVDVLITYGRRRTRHGAEVYFMDRRARDRARSDLGPDYRHIVDRLNDYLVVSGEGDVITAAKRRKRLKF